MELDNTTVIGISGEDLRTPAGLKMAAEAILHRVLNGERIIAVVGATPNRERAALAEAIALGATADGVSRAQRINRAAIETASELNDALFASGVASEIATPEVFGPLTRGGALEAEPRRVSGRAFADAIDRSSVLVVPGGAARGPDGEPASLGSGGASLHAVFLAEALALPVRLTPGSNTPAPTDIPGLASHDEWLDELAETEINRWPSRRARLFARDRAVTVILAPIADPAETIIGATTDASAPRHTTTHLNASRSRAASGLIPAAETIARLKASGERIASIQISLSPGAGAVIDHWAAGETEQTAAEFARNASLLSESREAAIDELSGLEGARRLAVLAEEAFGLRTESDLIARRGLETLDGATATRARSHGRRFRLIATARRENNRLSLRLGPIAVREEDPLATEGPWGAVVIETEAGHRVVLRGHASVPDTSGRATRIDERDAAVIVNRRTTKAEPRAKTLPISA